MLAQACSLIPWYPFRGETRKRPHHRGRPGERWVTAIAEAAIDSRESHEDFTHWMFCGSGGFRGNRSLQRAELRFGPKRGSIAHVEDSVQRLQE